MLNNISWHSYWTVIALLVALYYTLVLLLFYRNVLVLAFQKRYASSKHKILVAEKTDHPHISLQQKKQDDIIRNEAPEYLPAVHSLVDEVQSFFESCIPSTFNKENLIRSLHQIILKHPGVKGTAYQYSISNLIVFLAEQNCSIHLSVEEAGHVWL